MFPRVLPPIITHHKDNVNILYNSNTPALAPGMSEDGFQNAVSFSKSLNGLGPKYLTEMLPLYEPSSRPLRSTGNSWLMVPWVKTNHGKAVRLKTFMFTFAFC